MRKAAVLYNTVAAGTLTETDDGEYTYQYHDEYIANHPNKFITFTMPVNNKLYIEKRLFPFFEGLIPEGWLLDIAAVSWKINRNDRMGLLMACCHNCIGAVSVLPIHDDNE
jgi:serine/threonine-protein kinase HipA